MNPNSIAIAILGSHLRLGEDIHPLEPREWGTLAQRMIAEKFQPAEILEWSRQDLCERLQLNPMEADRILRLGDRSGSLSFELSKFENMGIRLIY